MVLLTAVFGYTLLCAIVPTCDFIHEAPDNRIRDEYYTGRETAFGEKILKNPYPVVFTNDGGLQGYSMGTVQGNRIYAFEGLRYGQAPIGDLRFRSPVASKPWTGIRAAHKPGAPCLQVHPLMILRVIGSEDCLFLNIYTPQLPTEDVKDPKIPVIVWFHGGSFIFGQSNEYGPSYIVDRNVILVTVNYRLGVLGFMSTGDQACSGNMGLKDQALALKWIHENIRNFGGDPGRVTIMGQSAGAVSVHLHIVANKSREYFQAGISMSASGYTHWGVQTKKQALYWTNWLADVVKCPTTRKSSADLVDCFRAQNPAFLVSKTVHLFKWLLFPPVLFAPVVEPVGPDAFLSDTVENHYRRGDVARYPWIGSLTSQEGYTALFVLKLFQQFKYLRRMFGKLQQYVFSYDEYFTNDQQRLLVDEKIRKYYFQGESPETVDDDRIAQIFSDRYFIPGQVKALKAHSQLAPTYAYLFGFNGHTNIGNIFGLKSDEWGVGHNEDSFYFFNSTRYYAGFHKGQPAMEMSQIMVNLIGNFADKRRPLFKTKTGDLVSIWDPVKPLQEPRFLNLNKDVKMVKNPFVKDIGFWESLRLPDTTPPTVFNYTLKESYFRSNRILR